MGLSDHTGKPVAEASVVVDGTNVGTRTDEYGRYLLPDIPNDRNTIIVRMIGYEAERRVLSRRVPHVRGMAWTPIDDVDDCNRLVEAARAAAGKRPLAEWELDLYDSLSAGSRRNGPALDPPSNERWN